tara:strand:+ start:82 stop:279 length:198 start_codon:yes stop_codon:yes gene_type:complete
MQHRLREGVFERTNARMVLMACQMTDKIRGLEKALEEAEMSHFLDMDAQALIEVYTRAKETVKEE